MKNSVNRTIICSSKCNYYTKSHINHLFILTLIILMFGKISAQTVINPISGVSSNFKKYIYTYQISDTQKKDIEYILILSSTNEVKSVFNACDVCYQAHKGYSKTGNELRCNNCGNRFKIDSLGKSGTGGTCNPGYLPHTIDGDNVVINVSDLIKGEYFFLATDITDVKEDFENNIDLEILNTKTDILVKTNDLNNKNISIYNLNGNLIYTLNSNSNETNISKYHFTKGMYLLNITENGKSISKLFWIY